MTKHSSYLLVRIPLFPHYSYIIFFPNCWISGLQEQNLLPPFLTQTKPNPPSLPALLNPYLYESRTNAFHVNMRGSGCRVIWLQHLGTAMAEAGGRRETSLQTAGRGLRTLATRQKTHSSQARLLVPPTAAYFHYT